MWRGVNCATCRAVSIGSVDPLHVQGIAHEPGNMLQRGDLIAGLCVAGLLLPEAVAYAGLAHLPLAHGLVGALLGLALYAGFGGSRFAVVAPTSSTATLAMAAVLSLYPGRGAEFGVEYVQTLLALVLLCGGLLVLLGMAGQGQLSTYISRPVLKGFAFALAISIVLKQLPDALGFALAPGAPADPPEILWYTLTHWQVWHGPSAMVAAAAAVLLWLLRRWPAVPASLLVLVAAMVASWCLDFQTHGIHLVGLVTAPRWRAALPELPMHEWLRAAELAFGLVMLVFAESWGSMRSMALAHGDGAPNPNRELIVIGGCNVLAALFQGMPVGAGFSATAANAAAGAVSRKAGLVALLSVGAAVLLALPALQYLPRPVLAVAVMGALTHALSPQPIWAVWRMGRDRALLLVAVLAVLLLGVLDGMLVAIGLSMLSALRRFSQPVLHELGELGQSRNYVDLQTQPGAWVRPGMLILRPEEPLFFGSAERVVAQVLQRVQARSDVRTVVLSLEESADLDSTAVDCLCELELALRAAQTTLVLARVKTTIRGVLARVDPLGVGVAAQLYWSVADAVAAVPALPAD